MLSVSRNSVAVTVVDATLVFADSIIEIKVVMFWDQWEVSTQYLRSSDTCAVP